MARFARIRPVLALVVLLAAVAVGVVAAAAPVETRVVVHYQKNMKHGMAEVKRLAGDILARAPDTVSLQEVNGANRDILDALRPKYPAQKICLFPGIGHVAVLSRWPMVEGSGRCLQGQGMTAIQVELPEGRVWVMSVHLETPDKPLHRRMVRDLAADLGRFTGPTIIGGDFNALPGSASLRMIAEAAGVTELGPRITTRRLLGFLDLTIDHVLATGGRGRVEQLPLIGSDHFGVLAFVNLRFEDGRDGT